MKNGRLMFQSNLRILLGMALLADESAILCQQTIN